MLSAKRQKSKRMRKWAARCGSIPLRTKLSASLANSAATGAGLLRAEQFGIEEDGPQHFQRRQSAIRRGLGREKIIKGEAVGFRAGAGEVGMDLEALLIARHHQRRILQVFAVAHELAIGRRQIAVLALILPGEVAALPHIREALAVFRRGNVL